MLSKLEIFTNLKKNCIGISVFGYENRKIYPIYVSKYAFKRHFDLVLIKDKDKLNDTLTKDFNRFIYNQTLHRNRKHFCRYCLQSFSTAEMLKRHTNDCCKVNGEQRIKMPKRR